MAKNQRDIYDRNSARVKVAVSRGASTREIAEELDCSTSTAHKCKRKAQRDLDVSEE